jgi:mannose-6-phosphate isomerase-like protein (cupin superfamily)
MIHIKEHEIEGERFDKPYARVVKHLAAPWTVGTTKMWLGVSVIDPRSCSNPHTHNDAEEIFYVISGCGKILVEEEQEEVGPGSCVFVPIGKEHQLINDNDEIFKVVAITSPPFQLKQFNATHLKKDK